MNSISIQNYRNIVILTGAGISVASGLRPYRGQGGLWEECAPEELATASVLADDPRKVWSHIGPLRAMAEKAVPNAAHESIAQCATQLRSGATLTLITQNIDGLHQRAGSEGVIELHGSAFESRCTSSDCSLALFYDVAVYEGDAPLCPECNSHLRPGVVLFEEMIPAKAEWLSKRALRDCDLFISVGTSGSVFPAANYVNSAKYSGARTIFVNTEAMSPPNPAFDEEYIGAAETLLPLLFAI